MRPEAKTGRLVLRHGAVETVLSLSTA